MAEAGRSYVDDPPLKEASGAPADRGLSQLVPHTGASEDERDDDDTPRTAALRARGLRLTDFHAGSSVCTPSRAALMTGRHGLRTGVNANFNPYSLGGLPL